jgi:hypothetical protein
VRWRLGRSTSYQLIDAAEVVERLSAIADTKDVTPTSDPPIPLPATESVARELVPLKQQPEAFPMNLRTGGGHAPEYVCENHFEEAASETPRGREPMVPSVPRSGPKVHGRATGYEKPRNEHRTPVMRLSMNRTLFPIGCVVALVAGFQLFLRYQYVDAGGTRIMRIDRLSGASCYMPCSPTAPMPIDFSAAVSAANEDAIALVQAQPATGSIIAAASLPLNTLSSDEEVHASEWRAQPAGIDEDSGAKRTFFLGARRIGHRFRSASEAEDRPGSISALFGCRHC